MVDQNIVLFKKIRGAIERDKYFFFTLLSILSTIGMILNVMVFLQPTLGAFLFVIYLIINVTFIGRIFFKDETTFFKMSFGSVTLLMFIVIANAILVLLNKYNVTANILSLSGITIVLSISNRISARYSVYSNLTPKRLQRSSWSTRILSEIDMHIRTRHSQRRRTETTALLLETKCTDLVLDIGCGDCSVTTYYASDASYVVGLDTSSELLKVALLNTKDTNVALILGEASKLPFRPSCFDKITVLELLEHLREPELCVGEANRCMKKNGLLVASVPNREKRNANSLGRWGHMHSFDEADIMALFAKNYKVAAKIHLLNLLSWLPVLQFLPLRVWLVLNNFLGLFKKGYWVIFKFRKISSNLKSIL